MSDELAEWTSHGQAVLYAHMVLSLPPREKAICERLLLCMKNWPAERSFTYAEFLQMFKAAGASPADIALVGPRVQEGLKEKQAAGAVIAPFPGSGRQLPP